MVCQVCGGTVVRGQRFCAACGTRIALEPPPIGSAGYAMPIAPGSALPVPSKDSRVNRHLRSLGLLWIVYGVFRLLRGIVGLVILHTISLLSLSDIGWAPNGVLLTSLPVWLNRLLPLIAALTILGMLLSFATAYALLTRRPWSRALALASASLALIKFPVGTALGLYTLWVLAPAGSRVEAGPQQDS